MHSDMLIVGVGIWAVASGLFMLCAYVFASAAYVVWVWARSLWQTRINTYAKRPVPAREIMDFPDLPEVLRRKR